MSVFPNTHVWEQQDWNGTDGDDKKRGVSVEKSKAGTKERSLDSPSQPNKNIIIIINKTW